MNDYNKLLEMWRQEKKKRQEAEGEITIVKGIGMNSPEMKEATETITQLRQRISELIAINKSHQDLMGKQIVENEELKRDNKALAKQIDDYFNARLDSVRKSGA
jgi:FtsZ-binding cell division protein ZapB